MMDWLIEPLSLPFMQTAIIAGSILGALCASIGVFVVQRGLAFIGDGLAHAAFGGIALGLLLDVSVEQATLVALPFTGAVALGIGYVLRHGRIGGDVATGVFFAVSFALGILFIGLRPPDAAMVSIESILFGSILAVSQQDLYAVVGIGAVTAVLFAFTYTRMAYATFDPELAELSGVPVARLDYMLLALTAVVIVVSVKTVGIVLVSSFVVIPAATARLVAHSLTRMVALAMSIGVLGAAGGLVLSYHLDVASGATIILLLGAGFGLSLVVGRR
jgi:zinc transport system permease protein